MARARHGDLRLRLRLSQGPRGGQPPRAQTVEEAANGTLMRIPETKVEIVSRMVVAAEQRAGQGRHAADHTKTRRRAEKYCTMNASKPQHARAMAAPDARANGAKSSPA